MPRRGRKGKGGAQPIPKEQEDAIVRKMSRNVIAAQNRRWNVELAGLDLGSYAGNAKLKGLSFGTTPKTPKSSKKKPARALKRTYEGIGGASHFAPMYDEDGVYVPPKPNYLSDGSMVGVAPHSMNLQVVQPRITSSFVDGVQVDILEGTDIVGPVNLGSVKETGDVLMEVYISPSALHATRMAQLAPLYQRYRFLDIEFLYEPIANATQSGQVIGFCTFDPDAPLATSDASNLNKAAAFMGNKQNQIWEPASYGQHQPKTMTDLYVDPSGADSRFSYQGIFYLVAAGTLQASGGLALGQIGNIYVRYRLQLSIPQLQSGVGSIAAARMGFVPAIAAGNPAYLGNDGLVPLGSSNTLTVQYLTADSFRVVGVTPGSFMLVGLSADWTGTGGTASSSGVTSTPNGATLIDSSGAVAAFNGLTGAMGFLGYYEVSSTSTSVDISFTGNITGLTGEGEGGLLLVVTFPPTVTELMAARRKSSRQLEEILSYFRPYLDSNRVKLGEACRDTRPDETRRSLAMAGAGHATGTPKGDLAALISRRAESRSL